MKAEPLRKVELCHFETSHELAEIKVSYKSKQKSKIKVSSSKDAFNILFDLFDKDTIEYQEQFYLLLLSYSNRVLGWVKLSLGGTTGTVVDPKIVFSIALKTNASGLIMSHNHPSGNLSPSDGDQRLTKKLLEAGRLLDIKLLDHLIVTSEETYFSFADDGIL
jgi:DNA repair protein RadC